jgi:hypothetical protein
MAELERPEAAPAKRSDLFRWVVLILVGGVALYAGSFAIGFLKPGGETFRGPRQDTAYVAPPSAPADKPTANTASKPSSGTSVWPPVGPPQSAELNSQKDTPPSVSTSTSPSATSDVATLPAGNPPQDADVNPPKDTASQDSDSPPTTSGLASEARPRDSQQDAAVNSQNNVTAQESKLPPSALGFAPEVPAASPQSRTSSQGADFNSRKDAPSQSSSAAHALKTTENAPPTSTAVTPKRHPVSESSQKMWYK